MWDNFYEGVLFFIVIHMVTCQKRKFHGACYKLEFVKVAFSFTTG
jgi:hypothetical protein